MISKVNDRFLTVVVGALVSYALLETAIAYTTERRERWRAWVDNFMEPFIRNPGRKEWLKETLEREEMTVHAVVEDCGCNDAS